MDKYQIFVVYSFCVFFLGYVVGCLFCWFDRIICNSVDDIEEEEEEEEENENND